MSKESRVIHIAHSATELEAALITIICHIQGNDFHEEIKQLKKQGHVDKSSSISSLSPFIDNANVLRVGGRLEASSLPYDSKHPMLIPYNDPLAKLLFVMFHEENKHCGPQALLSIARQLFGPIKGKSTARATVQQCIRCNKARPQLCQQIMGNLPESRITPARPFINAGVDYCGPFWIHYKVRGKKPTKAYIAVFCCFSTKAVHLELVTDLSTNAFIGALKRFISRRGRCLNIYSDNATNFVGAKNQLAELEESIYSNEGQEAIISACSTTGINFHFIPPRAPHFGGLWEASVKSAKYLLLRSVSTASLTYEELETVVMEIEAILNSRPLTPMSNDPTDLTALAPGHLLIGEALTTHVDSRSKPEKHTLLSRWNLVSQLKHNFWKRWSNEYLMELQQRIKWKTQSANIQLGDMVIIKEDNVPVMQWPLGRIVHVYKGTDGRIRVADVKTSTGILNPLLLTPTQLQKEVNQIKLHLSPSLELPMPKDELISLYRLMKVKGGITQQHAVFSITLPLIEHERFELFQLIPIPNWVNDSCSSILAINTQHDQYFPLIKSELSLCETIKEEEFPCTNVRIRYNFGSEVCACEVNLFNNNTIPNSRLKHTINKLTWIPLNHKNQWIYATSTSSRATAVCNKEIISLNLKGSGLLTIDPDCVLKDNFVSMQGQQIIASTARYSYSSLDTISELRLQPPMKTSDAYSGNSTLSTVRNNQYDQQLKELTVLQKVLQSYQINDLPNQFQSHKYYSFTIAYAALVIGLILIIIMMKKKLQKKHVEIPSDEEATRTTPIPMPRRQSQEFVINI
ncbi:uncharacterized protein LOC119675398 [Teleopsis dalmanni]|uniref:uncharacterized protein LOC119675398 n=1 Tax=Teleopsis dalmanni TaxID=139649 RepID=UPI0018CD6EFD|nr:uncharacterized protein LOC119675398 [Teleopsis dalmanni]